MKFLLNLIFIFFVFLITLSSNIFADTQVINEKSAHINQINQYFQSDVLSSSGSEYIIQTIKNGSEFLINHKKSNGLFGSGFNNEFILLYTGQLKKLLSYIYNQSYLQYKTKVIFIILLSEIFPNAP